MCGNLWYYIFLIWILLQNNHFLNYYSHWSKNRVLKRLRHVVMGAEFSVLKKLTQRKDGVAFNHFSCYFLLWRKKKLSEKRTIINQTTTFWDHFFVATSSTLQTSSWIDCIKTHGFPRFSTMWSFSLHEMWNVGDLQKQIISTCRLKSAAIFSKLKPRPWP